MLTVFNNDFIVLIKNSEVNPPMTAPQDTKEND